MTVQGTVWQPVGPSPIDAGREDNGTVTCIVVHPSNPAIIYRGTNSGGVWKTIDGGGSWTPLFDHEDGRGVGEAGGIALDPNDLDVVYLGISDHVFQRSFSVPFIDTIIRRGLYRSVDGGASWVLLGSGFPAGNNGNGNVFANLSITEVIVDPADSNTIYVGAGNGVYVSRNRGLTWTRGTGLSASVDSVELDRTSPTAARVLYAGVTGSGAFKSINGGASWTSVLPPAGAEKVIVRLAPPTSPANAGGIQVVYCCAASGGFTSGITTLFISTDAGVTWTPTTGTNIPGVSYTGYALAMSVDPASPGDGSNDIVYVGTRDQGVSTNSGASFTSIGGLHSDTHAWAFAPGTPSVVFCGTDGGCMRSADRGGTWTSLNAGGVQTPLFYNVDGKPDNTSSSALGTLQDNGILRDIGAKVWRNTRGGDGWDVVYDIGTANRAYGATNGGVFVSTDDGQNWAGVAMPWAAPEDDGSYINSFAVDPSNTGVVYVTGSQNLWQSRDATATWRSIAAPGSSGVVAVAPTNGNFVAVTGASRVFVSQNALAAAGVAFTDITRDLPGRAVTRIEFDPNDPTRIYITLGGYAGGGTGGHVFRTTLGATAWTNISPAASIDDVLTALDVPFGALALDGSDLPSTIYVGCDLGVLRSVNDGRSWMVVDDIHLPRVPVTDLAINGATHPKALRVATYGRGVFRFVQPDGPAITVALQDQLEFGTVCPGGAHRTIEVFNVGSAPLRIDSIASLLGSANFAVENQPATPVVIAPGEQLDFTLTYQPTQPNIAEQVVVRISSNDPDAPWVDVIASATAGAPQLDVSTPPAGDLGSTCLGHPLDGELMLTNSGTCPLTVTSITSSNAAFTIAVVTALPLTIGAGDSYELAVRFTPVGFGPASTTISFGSDDPKGVIAVELRARCGQPRLVTVVADSGFAGHVCLDDFADIDITVSNSGDCTLEITAIASDSAEFLAPSVAMFPISIAAGTSIEIPIRYQPTSIGDKAATITITSNDPASPHTVHVSGQTGHGTLVITGSACFGEVVFGTRVQQRLTFSNVGDCDLHITEVAFEHCRCPGCSTLKLVRNPFPATLHPGAALDLVLQYTATGGSACTRHLVVHSDDPDHPEVCVDVSAMTKPTLNSAIKGWLAHTIQSLLATQLDRPCDEGTFGPDDCEC
jgi:hypothetical protein